VEKQQLCSEIFHQNPASCDGCGMILSSEKMIKVLCGHGKIWAWTQILSFVIQLCCISLFVIWQINTKYSLVRLVYVTNYKFSIQVAINSVCEKNYYLSMFKRHFAGINFVGFMRIVFCILEIHHGAASFLYKTYMYVCLKNISIRLLGIRFTNSIACFEPGLQDLQWLFEYRVGRPCMNNSYLGNNDGLL
jgi:hypothetical protein